MWSLHTFEQKVNAANSGVRRAADNKRFWHKTTSLEDLWHCLETRQSAATVLNTLQRLSWEKRRKYYEALKYVITEYPGNLDFRDPNPRTIPHYSTFHNNYDPSRGDLIYGIHPGRTHNIYKVIPNSNGQIGAAHRYCDGFNNHLGIGKGQAFLAAKGKMFQATRVSRHVKNAKKQAGAPDFLEPFYDTLVGSRFAPDHVMGMKDDQLADSDYYQRGLLEKQWIKSIKRACKAGILAVATHPTFVNGGAKIHFILDGMGDLAKVARKEPLNDRSPYVSITTAEMTFCFRKWNLPPLNIKNIVIFYVAGKECYAPWEREWTLNDANDKPVHSGFQAWKRYGLYRYILRIPLMMTNDDIDMGIA